MPSAREIEDKTFATSFRGYSKKEVSEFLQEVAATMRDIEEDNRLTTQATNQALQNVPQVVKQEMDKKQELINKTLLLAEKTADDTRTAAREKAEAMLKEAEAMANRHLIEAEKKANAMIEEAQAKAHKAKEDARHYLQVIEHNLMRAKEDKRQFLSNLRAQLESTLARVIEDEQKQKEEEKHSDKLLAKVKNEQE